MLTPQRPGRVVPSALAILFLLVVSACSGAPAPRTGVAVTVSSVIALYDTPVTTTVSGLRGGEQVTLRLTTKAADGSTWSSAAQFVADPGGRLSTAQAPQQGSYRTVDPMGLFETLTPGHEGVNFTPPTTSPWTLTETVESGTTVLAATTITRQRPSELGVRATPVRPSRGGLYGELFLPAVTPKRPVPGVLVVGGSEGGLSTTSAALLAARGYPALALAYFHEPGLPTDLEDIPLEYFATAAKLLAAQPGVDRQRIAMWGVSRGSEAALLTAAHFPRLVGAAIGGVPGAEAIGGLPRVNEPAWTLSGEGVVTAPPDDFLVQSATSAAAIPVERIAGPILLVCGGQDQIWRSCANSAAIADRLSTHGRPAPTVLSYPTAGHFVGSTLPYLPSTSTSGRTATGLELQAGGTFPADQAARADAWPRILAFLRALTR